jgi:hypothetical protein
MADLPDQYLQCITHSLEMRTILLCQNDDNAVTLPSTFRLHAIFQCAGLDGQGVKRGVRETQ